MITKFISKTVFIFAFLLLGFSSLAKEGMWIPTLLQAVEGDMQTTGLQISAEDIYSINHSSLKDAIVHFGGGCTAEMISSEGLLLTNHHCGYSQIQQHSSLENNYLEDGFWAMTRQDELKNPGLTATFIIRIEDVTDLVLKGVNEGGETTFLSNIKNIEDNILSNEGFDAKVKEFNYGNSYYVIVTQTYRDVRLVGAPPSSVGKFGGDTDNWMWPRHTGDFSMFRIYADKDNNPADISENNVPYHPKHSLPINMKGLKEGDFTMVYGFPGRTEQYLTSYGVDYVMNKSNPMRIDMRRASLAIIDKARNEDPLVKIQYAAKQSRISNSYKKWIGQNKGLAMVKAMDIKRNEEQVIIDKFPKYQAVLDRFQTLYNENEKYNFARDLFIEYYYVGPEILRFSMRFDDLVQNYDTLKVQGKLDEKIKKLKASTRSYFKNYQVGIDKEIFDVLTKKYMDYMDADLVPEYLKTLQAKTLSKGKSTSEYVYKKSIFSNEEKVLAFLNKFKKGSIKKIKKDPVYRIASGAYNGYFEKVRPKYSEYSSEINALMKDHVLVLKEAFPDKVMWPDANSTLRLTYGKAEGTEPVDGKIYKFYTTAKGILEKYDPSNPDFVLPPRLIDLIKAKDYGQYATDGELRVCFLGSNHTTGGNSGSPALDGNGHLIGLNFDRTWESTMSDIMFDPNRCRNIMVDIKYVLFIIDKYAGAGHLIDEMELVK